MQERSESRLMPVGGAAWAQRVWVVLATAAVASSWLALKPGSKKRPCLLKPYLLAQLWALCEPKWCLPSWALLCPGQAVASPGQGCTGQAGGSQWWPLCPCPASAQLGCLAGELGAFAPLVAGHAGGKLPSVRGSGREPHVAMATAGPPLRPAASPCCLH